GALRLHPLQPHGTTQRLGPVLEVAEAALVIGAGQTDTVVGDARDAVDRGLRPLDSDLGGPGMTYDVRQRLPDRGEDLRPDGHGYDGVERAGEGQPGAEPARFGVRGGQGLDVGAERSAARAVVQLEDRRPEIADSGVDVRDRTAQAF